MKLNELNNIPAINNHMDNLPGIGGRNDLRKAIRKLQNNVLTPAMGDRPDAPNICIFFTPERKLRRRFRIRNLRNNCYRAIIIQDGVLADLDKIRDRVCPEAAYFDGMCMFKC